MKKLEINQNDIKNIIVFSGTIIIVIYAFYALLVNNVHLRDIFPRLFCFLLVLI